jgi:hypothetical protein
MSRIFSSKSIKEEEKNMCYAGILGGPGVLGSFLGGFDILESFLCGYDGCFFRTQRICLSFLSI